MKLKMGHVKVGWRKHKIEYVFGVGWLKWHDKRYAYVIMWHWNESQISHTWWGENMKVVSQILPSTKPRLQMTLSVLANSFFWGECSHVIYLCTHNVNAFVVLCIGVENQFIHLKFSRNTTKFYLKFDVFCPFGTENKMKWSWPCLFCAMRVVWLCLF